MSTEATLPEPIIFTESAAAKVADLITEEGNPDLKLRVFVQGGGCSGFQYGFTFEEETNEDDTVMTKNGVSPAHRRHELPVPGGRGDRLQGRPARCAVCDSEPQCRNFVRLRLKLLGVSGRLGFLDLRSCLRCIDKVFRVFYT